MPSYMPMLPKETQSLQVELAYSGLRHPVTCCRTPTPSCMPLLPKRPNPYRYGCHFRGFGILETIVLQAVLPQNAQLLQRPLKLGKG